MLGYCVPVGAHIIDKVFFVQGQANCFLRSGITCTKRSKPAPLFCWPWFDMTVSLVNGALAAVVRNDDDTIGCEPLGRVFTQGRLHH